MHHPNTVQFLGACTRKQPFMIITEYMPGGSLADLLKRPSSFPSMRRAIVMAMDCARAMAYLHLLECAASHRHRRNLALMQKYLLRWFCCLERGGEKEY